MAITNKLGVWGTENDYGSDWFSVNTTTGRINGFQPNAVNYATKMNQALKNATLLSYGLAEVLAGADLSENLTIGAEDVTNAKTFATNLGTAINSFIRKSSGVGASKGSLIEPVYISAAGTFTPGSTYAGGTNVTLNGASKTGSTASIYAPETAGTTNQIVKWVNGAPSWQTTVTFSGNNVASHTTTYLEGNKTYLIVPTPGNYITVTQYVSYQTEDNITHQDTKTFDFYGPLWVNIYKFEYEYVPMLAGYTEVGNRVEYNATRSSLTVDGGQFKFKFSTSPINTVRIFSAAAYTYYDMTSN